MLEGWITAGFPLPGSIYDATQSYDISFYSAGALLFVCAGLHCAVPLAQRLWSQDSRPVKSF